MQSFIKVRHKREPVKSLLISYSDILYISQWNPSNAMPYFIGKKYPQLQNIHLPPQVLSEEQKDSVCKNSQYKKKIKCRKHMFYNRVKF